MLIKKKKIISPIHTGLNANQLCDYSGRVLGIAVAVLFSRMDRIKARQQKYKKGKERMLSLTQESGEGQDIQKLSEEDDESMSRHFPLVQVA